MSFCTQAVFLPYSRFFFWGGGGGEGCHTQYHSPITTLSLRGLVDILIVNRVYISSRTQKIIKCQECHKASRTKSILRVFVFRL